MKKYYSLQIGVGIVALGLQIGNDSYLLSAIIFCFLTVYNYIGEVYGSEDNDI